MQKVTDKLLNAWRSKVVLMNALLLVLLPFTDQILAALPQLREFIPENIYKTVGALAVVANLLLRFATSRPLEAK